MPRPKKCDKPRPNTACDCEKVTRQTAIHDAEKRSPSALSNAVISSVRIPALVNAFKKRANPTNPKNLRKIPPKPKNLWRIHSLLCISSHSTNAEYAKTKLPHSQLLIHHSQSSAVAKQSVFCAFFAVNDPLENTDLARKKLSYRKQISPGLRIPANSLGIQFQKDIFTSATEMMILAALPQSDKPPGYTFECAPRPSSNRKNTFLSLACFALGFLIVRRHRQKKRQPSSRQQQ